MRLQKRTPVTRWNVKSPVRLTYFEISKKINLLIVFLHLDTILRNLNLSVDPCTDFYEFSCGGWIKDHPVPPTQSHKNQFQVVEDRLQLQIKGKY